MVSSNADVDYRDLAIYITKNLYEIFTNSDIIFTKPYKSEDKLSKEFKFNFCSFSNKEVYSLSYKLLMELNDEDNILIENRISEINKNILNRRNSFIFFEYLINILEKDKESYQNDCIKYNILILLLYLSKNDCKRLICSNGYFNICINELKKIYKDIETPKTCDIDNKIIKKYKKQKVKNFSEVIKKIGSYFNSKQNYEELGKINVFLKKYKNKEINSDNIEEYIQKNEKYLDIYVEQYYKILNTQVKKEEYERLKKILFFLNDLDQISCYLQICQNENFSVIENFNEVYEPISISQKKEEDLSEDLRIIISSDDFYEKLKEILESKSVQNYMIKRRKVNDLTDKNMKEFYNIFFVDELSDLQLRNVEDNNMNIDDLKKEYDIFINKYNQKDWFKSIITYKYLPNGIRGFVNQAMMIAVNPLFIKKSNLFLEKENKDIKKKVLSSYLIIVLIYEIIQLLKFLKKAKFEKIEEIPSTPNRKKGGEMFIKYLFGNPIITKIKEHQADKILDINNWKYLSKFQDILPIENLNEHKDENNENEYYISFYITNIKEKKEDNKYAKEFTKY